MKIYTLKHPRNFETVYCSIEDPQASINKIAPKPTMVYISTRSTYVNGMFGHSEQRGWIEKDELIPLRDNKKNRVIVKQIEKTIIDAQKRIDMWRRAL